MTRFSYPNYPPQHGYMSEKIQRDYITAAIADNVLPGSAHRVAEIVSLVASDDPKKPIQFWQLYSVLGHAPIVAIAKKFYRRVFDDEEWFSSAFARIGGVDHHIRTQSSMWLDVMGGGFAYHGGEFRLNFHHSHNAIQVMNDQGGARWTKLMVETLDDSADLMAADARIRPSINTFLAHFFSKYAAEFNFTNISGFGETNPAYRLSVNFMNMTADAIEALSEGELREALTGRGVDPTRYQSKQELVGKALRM